MYTLEGISSVVTSLLLMKSLNKTDSHFLICSVFLSPKTISLMFILLN